MKQGVTSLDVATRRGFTEITGSVRTLVNSQGITMGLCTLYIRHTSASLVIQENADSDVRTDLERFLGRLLPDGDPLFEHTAEGPDDMPAHAKAALLPTSIQIPVREGELALGAWQGIYVWEHRHGKRHREVIVHVMGE
jgi:secondary thiamine-phosphate synthase enzyme